MKNFVDLTGQRFGRLEVKKRLENKRAYGRQYAQWECKCDCTNTIVCTTSYLHKMGDRSSCGCLAQEWLHSSRNITHGLTNTRLFTIWSGMKQRCYNPHHKHFPFYGGKGIGIADEWLGEKGVENFYNWAMQNGYQEDLTIDRIDNNKGYCPDNCKWSTKKEQAINRSSSILIEHDGITLTLFDWSKKYNITHGTAKRRLNKGLTFEEIFAPPRVWKSEKQSNIKGIIWNKKNNIWVVKSIKNGKKDTYISEFKTLEEAIKFKEEYDASIQIIENQGKVLQDDQ